MYVLSICGSENPQGYIVLVRTSKITSSQEILQFSLKSNGSLTLAHPCETFPLLPPNTTVSVVCFSCHQRKHTVLATSQLIPTAQAVFFLLSYNACPALQMIWLLSMPLRTLVGKACAPTFCSIGTVGLTEGS